MEQRKKAIICLEGLGKQFQTTNGTVTALDDINLEILQGEIFGIIGLSGAGKSTLVRCINYLETPTAGRVIFEGQNLSMMKEAEIRKARQSMGMIFQQFNLLAQRNVLQNVCFPMEIAGVPKAEAKKRAAELLKLVGLEERMKAYPAQLSGGQKQRVAIARAMSTNPKVLLCDEATTALDPNTTKSILELLKKINRELGITVIVITHEMAVIESICDRVAIIDHSHIAESGRVSEIFSGPKSEIGRDGRAEDKLCQSAPDPRYFQWTGILGANYFQYGISLQGSGQYPSRGYPRYRGQGDGTDASAAPGGRGGCRAYLQLFKNGRCDL